MKTLFSLVFVALSTLVAMGQPSADVKKYNNDAEVPRMSIEEAKKSFDEGTALFVDARAPEIYKQEHIKGAVIIEGAAEDRFDKLPKGKKIIVYCS